MNADWNGKWALVTGASAGIGKCFAEQLAAARANLILTARRVDRLEELASKLREEHNVQVVCFGADLEQPDAPQQIFDFTQAQGLTVDVLINNAGFGTYGRFEETDRDRETAMVQVNCAAVVNLTRLFVDGMVERRRGYILIVASTAAFQAVPYMAVYAATKSFDLLFAEALAQELKRFGIRVCALCPGYTHSEFHAVAGAQKIPPNIETAEKVARVGLKALAAGKPYVVSGWSNRFGARIQRLVPRRLVSLIAERMFRPK